MSADRGPQRFDPAALAGVAEPVRRYFAHALCPGASITSAVRLTMTGRIRVGVWLPFTAEQDCDGHRFEWRARVGFGPVTLLRVVDRYRDGAGAMEGRLLGRARLFGTADENTTRSAAGRTALEAIWAPGGLLPQQGIDWRAESDELIVATWPVPPERPELHLRIDGSGAVRSVSLARWGAVGQPTYGYIPCGASVEAERRFDDLVLPTEVTVGWWFGTPRYAPFFRARLLSATRSITP